MSAWLPFIVLVRDVPTLRGVASAYPLSCVALAEFDESPLSRTVFPTGSKYFTGTKPLVFASGLHASYQSVSFSRLMTCKKSPAEKDK